MMSSSANVFIFTLEFKANICSTNNEWNWARGSVCLKWGEQKIDRQFGSIIGSGIFTVRSQRNKSLQSAMPQNRFQSPLTSRLGFVLEFPFILIPFCTESPIKQTVETTQETKKNNRKFKNSKPTKRELLYQVLQYRHRCCWCVPFVHLINIFMPALHRATLPL